MGTTRHLARPPQRTLRHLWLAGLGLGSITGKQVAHVRELAQRIAAGQKRAARQALYRLGDHVPSPLRERIPPPVRDRIGARLRAADAMAGQTTAVAPGRALHIPASKPVSPAITRGRPSGPHSGRVSSGTAAVDEPAAPPRMRHPTNPMPTGTAQTPRPPGTSGPRRTR